MFYDFRKYGSRILSSNQQVKRSGTDGQENVRNFFCILHAISIALSILNFDFTMGGNSFLGDCNSSSWVVIPLCLLLHYISRFSYKFFRRSPHSITIFSYLWKHNFDLMVVFGFGSFRKNSFAMCVVCLKHFFIIVFSGKK